MEGRYPPGVFISLVDCNDPAREAEFNQWYNDIMIPHMESLGFIRNTSRYENVFSNEPTFRGRPKYLALSEVYRDDLEQAIKEIRQAEAEFNARGHSFDAMIKKVDTLYRRIGPEFRSERTGRPVTGLNLGLTYALDTRREDEMNKWYDEIHSPETVEWGPYDTGYRFKVVDINDPVPHTTSAPYLAFYETSIDPLTAIEELQGFRKKCEVDRLWVELQCVSYTGAFRKISP